MKIGLGIQVILRLLPRQSEKLLCWYYLWEGCMMYTVKMTSDGMAHTKFYDDRFRNSSNIKGLNIWEAILLVL
jgi:hypothetical protein